MTLVQPASLQVVIDCADPHVLADWWAETIGWEVEPQDESFIRQMIERGFATEADTVTHNGSLVWATATAVRPRRTRPPPVNRDCSSSRCPRPSR